MIIDGPQSPAIQGRDGGRLTTSPADGGPLTASATDALGAATSLHSSAPVQAGDLRVVDAPAAAPVVSVVIPTLNEENNIAWVLERLPALVDEVVLVDGRSTDNTIAVARSVRPDLRLVLETQPGKGAALRAGFAAARGEYIVMIDADGSMDPAEITRFVDALRDGCDMVKGSRFAPGGGTADISPIRQLGNDALRRAVNLLYRTNFTDLCYGFIAFRRERLEVLRLYSAGFEIETEMISRAVVASLRIGEVPSFEAQRRYGESNLRAWRDGRRALKTLLQQRFILPRSELVARRAACEYPERATGLNQGVVLEGSPSWTLVSNDASATVA
jgi:glycosyltransferase involved in cell wall biosynthesis